MIDTDTMKSDPTWTRETSEARPYVGLMCLQEQLYLRRLTRNRWRKLGFRELENGERRVIRRIMKKIEERESRDE